MIDGNVTGMGAAGMGAADASGGLGLLGSLGSSFSMHTYSRHPTWSCHFVAKALNSYCRM